MQKSFKTAAALVTAMALFAAPAIAQTGSMSGSMDKGSMGSMKMSGGNPMVGGAAMSKKKTIVANAANSKDHTTLVAAVKAAGLVATLSGPGPFTVFAPTNEAFDALPAGTVDSLMKPAGKATLTKVLTYHVVAGKLDSKALSAKVKMGGGVAKLKTVEGEILKVKMAAGGVTVTDAKGGVAKVTIADVYQSNGVIHVVDKVLMP